jgi:hypothetical protein
MDQQVFPRTWTIAFPFIADRNKRFTNLDVFVLGKFLTVKVHTPKVSIGAGRHVRRDGLACHDEGQRAAGATVCERGRAVPFVLLQGWFPIRIDAVRVGEGF